VVQTGTYISGLGHVAVIGWVILGSALTQPKPATKMQVTSVSLISKASFAALGSNAPSVDLALTQPGAPKNGPAAPIVPSSTERAPIMRPPPEHPRAKPGQRPDLGAVRNLPRTQAQLKAPQMAPQAETDSVGASLVLPSARIDRIERAGIRSKSRLAMVVPSQPKAPKVDTRAAPKPPNDAEKAKRAQKSTTPDPKATKPTKPTKPKIEKAPDQASSEIVTEAKQSRKTAAPVATSRPRGRPANLTKRVRQARDIKSALARAQAEAHAKASRAAAPAARAPTPSPTPNGPPLTQGEKDGLILAVQECWNVNPTSESARITVVVGVRMEKNGKPQASSIRLISASPGSGAAQRSAFGAARRAILRCAKSGYKLPIEKYDRWRDIEMTFNPDKMRIK